MDTNLHFTLPTEVFSGRGCVAKQAQRWMLGRHALIVTGKTSARLSGALDDVCACLDARQIPYVTYEGISANPDETQVYAGAAVARTRGCDFVIAIGGGSVLDAAKSIAWVVASDVPREAFFNGVPATDPVLPIVAIPLTCGTGSEVTQYSIITDHEAKTKKNVSSAAFFPTIALLDAHYLTSLPKDVLCDTALDALSHAIEGIYSLKADCFSRALAETAIGVLMPELVRMAHGTFVNLAQLQYGSMVAGMVIAQTGTGLVHAMGYPLTYYKGMPHGRANGVLLAGYLTFMQATCASLTERILAAAGLSMPEELQALVDTLLDIQGCFREAPTEEELEVFTGDSLRLEVVRRYRTLPSPEEVKDLYRMGF
ncbi:MAG: iron-containing alcohol dehydrogenase [Kiritimatiellae bacterium]|nr:iron-containing alcohol dehydrogenase [Kiritimatiellia bacterium]